MLSALEIENKLKTLKSFIQAKYSVSRIGYFGSFSQGTATEASDIDILIELGKPIGWEFFDLQLYLESQLNRKVDLTTTSALKEQLKNKILKQVKYI